MSVVDDQDHTVPDGTTVNEVKTAIANLPEKYRLVTQMFYLEGYDHSEIASIMNISEAASRTCLFRGKSQIKKQLKHLDHGTGY